MEGDLQLFIYRCPDAQAYALSKVLARNGMEYDWDGPYAEVGTVAVAMEPYTKRPSAFLDEPRELANEIIEAAPGAWFQMWTDPDDGALGTLVQYVPELGTFEAYCDSNGQKWFTADELLTAARVGDEVAAKALTGWAWDQKLDGSGEERVIKAEPPAGESSDDHDQFFGAHSDAVAAALARDAERES